MKSSRPRLRLREKPGNRNANALNRLPLLNVLLIAKFNIAPLPSDGRGGPKDG